MHHHLEHGITRRTQHRHGDDRHVVWGPVGTWPARWRTSASRSSSSGSSARAPAAAPSAAAGRTAPADVVAALAHGDERRGQLPFGDALGTGPTIQASCTLAADHATSTAPSGGTNG